MPTVVTNDYRLLMATSGVNLSADSYVVALMGSYVSATSISDLKQASNWASVSAYEVTGTGYSAINLVAPTVSANTSNVIYWDGNNISWTNVTLTSYGYAIYRSIDNLVLGYVQFVGAPKTTVNGTISIEWNVAGIMNIFG